MVDLTPIKPWLVDDDLHHCQQAIFVIDKIGFDEWFKTQIETFCNCTKTFKDGRRCTQTNDKRYAYELNTTVKLIEKFGGYKLNYYYEELLKQHQINLEFEKTNGFEYNVKTNSKSKTKDKTIKKERAVKEPKPKKETAAERKLKANAVKMNAFIFKPKIINDETI